MNKLPFLILGTLLLATTHVREALGIGIDSFKDVLRPENLPGVKASDTGVEGRISEILLFAINLILYASGSMAVLFLVLGGIRYITSFGDQEATDHAKKIIKYAVMGLLAVILSYALVTNIIDLVYKVAG